MRLRSIDSNRSARPAVIPMMAIFLPRSILLWRESVARESAFQRAVPHGNLAGITSLEVRPGATKTFPRWKRAPLEEEARGPRIADRPAAGFIVQFEQRAALAARDARVGADGLDIGPGIDHPRRQRSFPEPPGGARCVYGLIGRTRVGCVAPAGCAAVGRPVGNAEAMNLPNDGVVGDAMAQFRGDLPHPCALRPAPPQN